MKCVSYTRTFPWKNHQSELTIAEQNQRIAAYLVEHKELDLQKKYSDRKNDEKARTAFDQMTNDGVERKFDCIIQNIPFKCPHKLILLFLIFSTITIEKSQMHSSEFGGYTSSSRVF